jgi:HSP20 family molecular chaperone IbpA
MSSLSLWTRRDPFAEFDALARRAFGPTATFSQPVGFTPAAEITKDGQDAVVRVELPGVDAANDVSVEVDRNRLVVSGERRDERTENEGGRRLREVRYGSFRRSFELPGHVTADAVTASYDAGVLSVRVANAYAGPETRKIAVTTGTPATPAVESAETAATGTEQPAV